MCWREQIELSDEPAIYTPKSKRHPALRPCSGQAVGNKEQRNTETHGLRALRHVFCALWDRAGAAVNKNTANRILERYDRQHNRNAHRCISSRSAGARISRREKYHSRISLCGKESRSPSSPRGRISAAQS